VAIISYKSDEHFLINNNISYSIPHYISCKNGGRDTYIGTPRWAAATPSTRTKAIERPRSQREDLNRGIKLIY